MKFLRVLKIARCLFFVTLALDAHVSHLDTPMAPDETAAPPSIQAFAGHANRVA